MLHPAEQARQLPIYAAEGLILDALAAHRVIVVEGPTGSGKTTQIPRILRRGLDIRRIGVTQPRRIAAVSVAWRIAAEEEVAVGDEVGYAIRFDDQTSPATAIKLMTDGILLMEARTDPLLSAYDVLMIDEAHERSLNIDVILGLVHRVLTRRDDLKVIISSATLFPEQFQRFFAPVAGEVPLISVPARTYPIDIQHRPPPTTRMLDVIDAVAEEVLRIHRRGEPGHVLVFLSGAGDIRRVEAALNERWPRDDMVVLPLFARLTREEQERVFDDFGSRRKVVLATNIAETSITIPDVRYVIDLGVAKIPRFSPRTGITALREELISRGSAEQRAGRAGRTGPGVALRLYSAESLADRPELTEEEILRLDLAEVVLRLIDLGIRDVEEFPFPTPPPPGKGRAALRTLSALGAIDDERRLTDIGRRMVPFPLSPRLARMVIEAAERFPSVVDDVLIVGAFLSARSPFMFPEGEEDAAREAHRHFFHPLGDAVAQVELYRAWSRSRKRKRFCERHYLDPEAMAFAAQAHEQLADIAAEQGIAVEGGGPREEIVRALAAGLVDQVIRRRGESFETLAGIRVRIHPSSVLAGRPPYLAVAAELVEHARTYAINISVLKREWLLEIDHRVAEQLGLRPSRRTPVAPVAAAPAVPQRLRLGELDLEVVLQRGRPVVELTLEQLPALRAATLPPEAKGVRARVRWAEGFAFAALSLPKLLAAVRLDAFPRPGQPPASDVAPGELFEADRDRHRIERSLDRVLQPAVIGRSAGWVAFVANGAGGYWLDIVPHFRDAVQTTRLSAEALGAELYEGDELQERAEALAGRLAEIESELF